MKTIKNFFTFLTILIKNKFFKVEKIKLYPGCTFLREQDLLSLNKNEASDTEEYYTTYRGTTRWQTL